jgi:hypothetical protein
MGRKVGQHGGDQHRMWLIVYISFKAYKTRTCMEGYIDMDRGSVEPYCWREWKAS